MHLIEITKNLPFKMKVKAGEQYLVDDINAGEILQLKSCKVIRHVGHGIIQTPATPRGEFDFGTILLIRAGGFGDLLFMTPTIRELKKTFKKVAVCCFDRYRAGAGGETEDFEDYPISVAAAAKYGVVIGFDGIMENEWPDFDATKLHAIDLFARACDVTLTDRHLSVGMQEVSWVDYRWPKTKQKRIGVQVYSSSMVRTYPEKLTGDLMLELHRRGYEVFLFGAPGEIRTSATAPDGVVNLSQFSLTFEQSISVLSKCDALIAPDSSLCHVAAALEIPTVALYGPFPSSLRVSHPCIKAIDGKMPCAPCFSHGFHLPKNKPCSGGAHCLALANITTKQIIKTLKSIL